MKQFGLTGINANVQFGKGSGRVKYDTDHFEVRNTADNSLIAVQAASPTNSNDLATKQYVDNAIQGLHVKDAVKVATDTVTANDMANLSYNSGTDVWTLTGTTLDGITVGNSRVLIKDATNKKGNGIFVNSGGYFSYFVPAQEFNFDISKAFLAASEFKSNTGFVTCAIFKPV